MKPRRRKLLVVDDDEGDRIQIIRCLEESSVTFDCYEASSVHSALDQMRTNHFDCAVIDYHMPGQNGLDGVKTLLRADPFLAVIMSTGQGDEHIASAAIKVGARDYIAKAKLSPVDLRDAIEGAVQQAEIERVLAEQQRALAVFARVLVHDMKAPTQSILGFAKLVDLFLDKDPIDRKKLKGQAQRIAEGAMRMDALLDQLHAYTEADAQPQFETISLDTLLRDVVADLDAVIHKAEASVIFGNLPVVCADRAQLTQLLQNLVGNGIKYCKARRPEVHVEAHRLANGDCVIEVRDNGIGIDEKHFADIFEPFKRLHSHGEFEGTGLGLTTCKKIVERHNGQIWCKSRLGEGTSFFFSLPLVCGEELPAE